MHFNYDNKRFALKVLYGPNVDSPLYFREVIFESDLNVGAECVVYAGDWNVTVNHELDNKDYLHVNNPRTREVIKDRMATNGLIDVWRLNNPLKKSYTWFQGGSETQARLDYFLVSPSVSDVTVGSGIEPADNLSDHGTAWIELGQTDRKWGRSFLRFNNLFLSDTNFLESTNSIIRETIPEYTYNNP